MFNAAVITCSDKGVKGLREDTSGEYIKNHLSTKGFNVLEKVIISDDLETIKSKLLYYADDKNVDLIITTGGTGFSPRDNTPEATKEVIIREVPGISEMLRAESFKITKRAYLSRGVSGIRYRTLIINLPGSLNAVKENMSFLDDVLDHGLKILKLVDTDCGE
ncbi:MogA/MoaB family molybdenum cofactor biosynthesis protein [Candidatus Izimaplasma bacterium]|nr:MogA/MoaB family molybdenum cofactor biosynthesis protein [Candidatus Izimaplasma bacterium]